MKTIVKWLRTSEDEIITLKHCDKHNLPVLNWQKKELKGFDLRKQLVIIEHLYQRSVWHQFNFNLLFLCIASMRLHKWLKSVVKGSQKQTDNKAMTAFYAPPLTEKTPGKLFINLIDADWSNIIFKLLLMAKMIFSDAITYQSARTTMLWISP